MGVRVHKIGGSDIKQEKLNNLVHLLELVEELDDFAVLLLHNKEESKAVKIVKNACPPSFENKRFL